MASVARSVGPTMAQGGRDFLNPNSMLTPGLAGGMTMLITNALCQHFPFVQQAQVALAISFLFGLLVLAVTTPWWKRIVYYVLNSLIVFCVAMGANGSGAAIVGATSPAAPAGTTAPAPPAGPAPTESTQPATPTERERLETIIRDLQGELARTRGIGEASPGGPAAAPAPPAPASPLPDEAAATSSEEATPFFRPWL